MRGAVARVSAGYAHGYTAHAATKHVRAAYRELLQAAEKALRPRAFTDEVYLVMGGHKFRAVDVTFKFDVNDLQPVHSAAEAARLFGQGSSVAEMLEAIERGLAGKP